MLEAGPGVRTVSFRRRRRRRGDKFPLGAGVPRARALGQVLRLIGARQDVVDGGVVLAELADSGSEGQGRDGRPELLAVGGKRLAQFGGHIVCAFDPGLGEQDDEFVAPNARQQVR
jgi:hypothetical protein